MTMTLQRADSRGAPFPEWGAKTVRTDRFAASIFAVLLALVAPAAQAQPVSLRGEPASAGIVRLEAGVRNSTVAPGDSTVVAVRADVDERYHIQSNAPLDEFTIPTELTVEAPEGFRTGPVSYPPHVLKEFSFAKGQKVAVLEDGAVMTFPVTVPPGAAEGTVRLKVTLTYQACDDQQCLPPAQAEVEVPLTVGPETSPPAEDGLFAGIGQDGGAPAPLEVNPEAQQGSNYFAGILEKRGWAFLLAAVYLAGLGLSFTPCVFPLIPITLGYFRSQASDNRRRTVGLAVTYVAGIATTYSLLGFLAASSGALFGSWLSSPWVLSSLALIIAVMGFGMFGAFELQPPAFIARRAGAKSGFAGAFAMGLIFGVVAAPCTGPATIALMAFAGALGQPVAGLSLFFVLALGIATPLMLLAIFSANLPTAGPWMSWVKKLLGALLLGVAVWLVSPVIGGRAASVAGGALMLGLGIWLGFLERTGFRPASLGVFRTVTGLAAAAGGIWLLLPAPERPGIEWQPYSPALVEQAAREGRPVIIDFSADWCLPCRELEHGAFRHPEAVRLSQEFVRLKVDATDSRPPEIQEALRRYGIRGVPTVLFIDRSGQEVSGTRILSNVPGSLLAERMRMVLEEGGPAGQSGLNRSLKNLFIASHEARSARW